MNFAKFRTKILICLSFLILTSLSISFGSYVIANLTINGDSAINIESSEDTTNYHKIEFCDGSTNLKTMYVKDGEKITLADAPASYIQDANNIINWVSNDNEITLSIANNSFTNAVPVYNDIVFSKNLETVNKTEINSGNISSIMNVDNTTFDGAITYGSSNVGSVVSVEETANNNKNNYNDLTINTSIINAAEIDLKFIDQDGDESIHQSLKSGASYQYTTDITIGLEDSAQGSERDTLYKPNTGSVNPCISKISLNNDLILTANASLRIGARVGYFAGGGWSQINWQGFIVGSYNELDLKGHTLVISNGCTLEVVGSVCDSVGGGKIIVDKGGTIKSTFVVEDQHHETTIPVSYFYGDVPFSMFRMPYLNVDLIVKKGGFLSGYLKIDFGGDGNDNMYQNDLGIVGIGENYIFDMANSSDDAYIERKCTFDEEMYLHLKNVKTTNRSNGNNTTGESISVNNICYERITYYFYNCELNVNAPKIQSFDLNMTVGDISLSFNRNRCDLFVPPYFQFYLIGSKVIIKNNINFYPGSYLFADKNSTIRLTAGNYFEFDMETKVGVGITYGEIPIPQDHSRPDGNQSVGGLLFIHEKFDYHEGMQNPTEAYDKSLGNSEYGWIDNLDSGSKTNYYGSTDRIFDYTREFWSYLNKNYPSKADINGKFVFDKRVSLFKENYKLGGEINISNIDDFVTSVANSGNRVDLYNNSFDGASHHMNPKVQIFVVIKDPHLKFNVSDYYTYPLISNGNVLIDINNNSSIRANLSSKRTYSFDTGLIFNSNENKYYAPRYENLNGEYNNWVNHLNKVGYNCNDANDFTGKLDDLRVVFREARINTDQSVTINSEKYIYFHGGFFKFENGTVDIQKFRNSECNYPEDLNGNTYRQVEYVNNDSYYGHATRRLS